MRVVENVRHLDVRIAQELLKMARLSLLDLRSYADTVAKKKIRTKAKNNVLKPKEKYRKVKRKLCTVLKQRDLLRAAVRVCLMSVCCLLSCHHCLVCVDTQVKALKRENANLKETIESL